MDIKLQPTQENPQVFILTLSGDLDGSNYQEVIQAVQTAYDEGTKYLLIDMREVPFMGSAGLVALHSAALIMRGENLPNAEDGWGALHAIDSAGEEGKQIHIKLLAPQPSVDRSLERTGMKDFFEVHTDLATAIGSF